LPQVVTAKVVTSAKSPGSKCFGFIVLATAEEAQQAIDNLNNTEVQGQTITVEKVPLMNHFCLLFSLLRCFITTTAHLMAIYPGQPGSRQLVLLRYPKLTLKPRFFAKTVRRRDLGFSHHN